MNFKIPENREELEAFIPSNGISKANKKLWLELWERGYYVQPVGQIHVGEIDYLIVSTCNPKGSEPNNYMNLN